MYIKISIMKGENMKLLSISEASLFLGLSKTTLKRWDKNGYLKPKYRTKGNHTVKFSERNRKYDLSDLKHLIEPEEKKQEKYNVLYSRVSSVGQKQDLIYQKEILKTYSEEKELKNIKEISDLGSGINFNKKGLKELIKLILNSEIETIYLTHKDRLLRFGTELIISICEEFDTKIKFLDEKEESFEEKLSKDVIEILTVFSSRLYGKRSHKNKIKLQQNKENISLKSILI